MSNIFGYPDTTSSNGHNYVVIQAQDAAGNWVGRSSVPACSPGGIRNEMENMKRQYPDSLVRAIDERTNTLYAMI